MSTSTANTFKFNTRLTKNIKLTSSVENNLNAVKKVRPKDTSSLSSFTNSPNNTSNANQTNSGGSLNLVKKNTTSFATKTTTKIPKAFKNKFISQSDVDLTSRSSDSRPHSADSSYSAATTSYRLKTKGM